MGGPLLDLPWLPSGWLVAPVLAGLALVLVKPGPSWVRRWRFLHLVPRPATVLWQAGTLSALIATVGAGGVAAWQLWHLGEGHPVVAVLMVAAAAFALNVVVRLVWGVVVVTRQSTTRRIRHRRSVDLLARVDAAAPTVRGIAADRVRVLAEAMPMAYCLPGVRQSRLVVSTGTLEQLHGDELEAVLAHERAHLRARHDVVLDWFASVHRAFPHVVRSDVALDEGRLLVEMLADDAARREVGSVPVARALVRMAGSPVPTEALGAAGPGLVERVRRLSDDREHRALSVAVYALAAVLVASPVGILVVL
ncbi:M56 family peptidase [Desertihabitans brevis]|uniref:M56 family peptidase n=1 Tax=Desertihabitans brevis TaxID=2268447 RepID=A0A367YZD3_9ACTN|nr:M56 family metallopeptidase [Desertihabitans brevis]RCK70311.1 M56 family peptidase [Desertihabitans brevis]